MTITTRWFAAVVAGTVAVAACSGGGDGAADTTAPTEPATTTTEPAVEPSPSTTAAPTTTSTSTSTPTTTTTLPAILRQPLTGQPLASESEVIVRPALAVKIDNQSAARPNQTGLAVADIVFEEIVEGRITRFLAIFHSQGSDPVGPIRSGRSQDPALVRPLGTPLFAWSGGNPGVTRLIAESRVVDLNAVRGGKGYYRGPGSTPHNLYNTTDALWAQTPADNPGPPPEQFDYIRPGESFVGTPAGYVEAFVGSVYIGWDWDAASGKYLRSQGKSPHVDATWGRIGATNVVIMGTPYARSVIDANSPEAQTVGSGPVWVFSDGQLVEGEWARLTWEAPIEFYDDAGEHIALTPGNTWIELAENPVNLVWGETR